MISFDRGPRFNPGRIVMTQGVAANVPLADIQSALRKHVRGIWDNLDPHDKAVNEAALARGGTILGSYHAENGTKFYIITELESQLTTVLLPEEY